MAATVFDFVIQKLTTEAESVQVNNGMSSNLSERTPLLTTTPDAIKQGKLYNFITAFSLFKVFVTDPLNKAAPISHYKY